jgi:hypothetical protein
MPMTLLRRRVQEGFSAGVPYALALYALAAWALVLYLLLCEADAKPVTYAHGTHSFTDLAVVPTVLELASLALLGAGLLSAHLMLRRNNSVSDQR